MGVDEVVIVDEPSADDHKRRRHQRRELHVAGPMALAAWEQTVFRWLAESVVQPAWVADGLCKEHPELLDDAQVVAGSVGRVANQCLNYWAVALTYPIDPHRVGQRVAHRPRRRSAHDPRGDTEPRMVIDALHDRRFPPIGQHHPADDVHLP